MFENKRDKEGSFSKIELFYYSINSNYDLELANISSLNWNLKLLLLLEIISFADL